MATIIVLLGIAATAYEVADVIKQKPKSLREFFIEEWEEE